MNMDVYNHGTLGVASDKNAVSLGNVWGGASEGWDTLLTTEAKIWPFFCALKSRTPSPVQQSSGKRQHSTGEIQTLLIRALWKYSTGVVKKNRSALSY